MEGLLRWAVTLLVFLSAGELSAGCVNLTWTASGDDGYVGRASGYDIRYSTSYITEQTFDQASRLTYSKLPQTAGTPEEFDVCWLPPNRVYYFAIKVTDENGNRSPISNVTWAYVQPDPGAHGDVNLDTSPYEIGDAVVFTNYFVDGYSAFTVDPAEQIAQTDANADGIPLTVSDLLYLLRVVIGDAPPITKPNPDGNSLRMDVKQRDRQAIVTASASSDIGALYLSFLIEGEQPTTGPILLDYARDMDMIYRVDGDRLRVLLFSFGREKIEAGLTELFAFESAKSSAIRLTEVEAVDYNGRPYQVGSATDLLLPDYRLKQNYPNPFNPTTTIKFVMPQSGQFRLEIFDITGRLVDQFSGNRSPGEHTIHWNGSDDPTGVYFYRLTTDNFTASKKMLLLK
ncbi:MAG: T9SS type A sorting domain-containing protein [candidate division Zixibacteria bacterium]